MAYAESTVGGSLGGQFRVWVNSIRTRQGGAADNSEDWRVEGGIKRVVAGSRVWNNYNQASYTVQLGMNGVASSGNFSYDFASGYTGPQHAWGTGATRVNRNSAGVGFGFVLSACGGFFVFWLVVGGGVGDGKFFRELSAWR